MPEAKVPYVTSYGSISKALEKIKQAATPAKFTQDFLATKLGLKGGSPKPVIPFLKRVGFLASDGSPTELYKRFRNPVEAESAAFQALRTGFRPLYEANEYAHDLSDTDLRGLIVSQTGLDGSSSTVASILGSFKALRAFAGDSTDAGEDAGAEDNEEEDFGDDDASHNEVNLGGIALGYTINLNLPATSDIAVFNAIFKAIRENLIPGS